MTKAEKFAELGKMVMAMEATGAEGYDYDMLKDFVADQLELLAKNASRVSKADQARRDENLVLKDLIMNVLREAKEAMSYEMLKNADFVLSGLSTQRMAALIASEVDAKVVVKKIVKGKTYFTMNDEG